MKTFEAASQEVEVNGETVLSVVAGLSFGADRARRVLASHGIEDPQPGAWFPQQRWLDAFREIAGTLGPNTLYAIGLRIPDRALFPEGPASMEEALAAIDTAYRMNHRGGPIGSYRFQALGPRCGRVVCDNPYPSDFDRGLIMAVAERHKPRGSTPEVTLEPDLPTRKTGGETCTFRVTW
ncbi:hypothetical protein [Mesoterricola silvestris]|uniref:Uncharacterized protein n=1 Tax=Mesoterricola silvestris TaxID=2927979 RepID=A0AA48GHL3_9BACT|nr:hypothetical protein [Mesoterricola silvestris]BDU73016.1 hypothetical protein METEAL_21900 [Mesoterricola silvestris]